MTSHSGGRMAQFLNSRWLVFVASMWLLSFAGIGYLFGSISPAIKSSLGYNQKQIARLGIAKDLADCVRFLAGSLCEILPTWGIISIGAIKNFIGYGWLWLIVTHRVPTVPLWVMCLLIFIGTNGETYFNTAALVSCVQNFPKNRGPIVGILKGFAEKSDYFVVPSCYRVAWDNSSYRSNLGRTCKIYAIRKIFWRVCNNESTTIVY